MRIAIIGLGEVGGPTFREFLKREKELNATVIGIDTDERVLQKRDRELHGYSDRFSTRLPRQKCDYYIICVYTTEQVMKVMDLLDHEQLLNRANVIIESTVLPGTYKKIKQKYDYPFNLVLFPHRFNPNDDEHYIFNLTRVMGADPTEADEALKLYDQLLVPPNGEIIQFSPEIVELTKPLENAYRFMEIVLAQEIKKICDKKDICFEVLREAMNSKWNINVKEARKGVGGKCLPKDMGLCIDYFDSNFLKNMFSKNELYAEEQNESREETD